VGGGGIKSNYCEPGRKRRKWTLKILKTIPQQKIRKQLINRTG
jgi:hypothetical protein